MIPELKVVFAPEKHTGYTGFIVDGPPNLSSSWYDIGWIDFNLRKNDGVREEVERLLIRAFEAGKKARSREIGRLIG
jgi:hypothetical protein